MKPYEEMHVFFEPKSVAVVGASKKINKAGHVIFKNFVDNKRRGVFKGELYPVNPNESMILGLRCYASITEIREQVDLAVIVVPAEAVPKVLGEAAEKRLKAAVIISGGFGEIGNEELEKKVVETGRKAGIRILGPNCLGVYDSKTGVDMLFLPETKIFTTGDEVVATPRPMGGPIAVVTQSGAFGVAALDFLAGRQLGVSKFVSFGNKCDVSELEMLEYLLHDTQTKVILLYTESLEKGRRFLNVARKVALRKPIIALKTGITEEGARAALSHTGALAGSDRLYDVAFKQAGILRARDLEEFFDVGKALAFQPPAAGSNIGIVTSAGGPGIMAVDECISNGLQVNRFSPGLLQRFEKLKEDGVIPKFATNLNPVDLTGSATSEMFEETTRILLEAPEIDGLIVLGLHHTPGLLEDFVDRIGRIVEENPAKPVVSCNIGETEMALYIRSRFDKLGIPCFYSPEDAARAMSALARYGEFLRKHGCFSSYLENFRKDGK